ncbi:nucleoside triphosphate pyrophosphohydrolase family protein [Salmonella enterica]|uniref:Cof hydrolase n=1 Tax=Salmonella phage UPF_BP2 TaxID=1913047 RepID=A0A286KIF4_9CAUD|nr:nucleotide pyrophosphohydrolase [Salmonella phage UPF_BP2]APU03074.1 Cof hydrolase [Salmonella phage UPF_BP2]
MRFSKIAAGVTAFHEKFDLKPVSQGGKPEFKLRYDRLIEEMEEIKQAKKDGDKAGFLDGIVDLIYIAAGTLYLYDQTAWFTNEFEYPILLTTPCGFMDRFDAEGLIVYVKDTEDTHCDRLAQLIIHLITWCANNNWPLDDAWDAVQAANMAKERAKPDASNSKHKSGQDIVKPEGWKAPDIQAIINAHVNPAQKELF